MLLLLSHFSHVRLCVTPETAAHQAPPFLGFSRQEHWSGLPFPSPMRESEFAQSCLTLSNSMDCSLPGSSIHGICQARVLVWVAIAFSKIQYSSSQNHRRIYYRNWPADIKLHTGIQKCKAAKVALIQKSNVRELKLPDFKTYYKVTAIKTAW